MQGIRFMSVASEGVIAPKAKTAKAKSLSCIVVIKELLSKDILTSRDEHLLMGFYFALSSCLDLVRLSVNGQFNAGRRSKGFLWCADVMVGPDVFSPMNSSKY